MTSKLLTNLVEQTNLYGAQYKKDNPGLPPKSRDRQWYDVTVVEMKGFTAMILNMETVRLPRITDYGQTTTC